MDRSQGDAATSHLQGENCTRPTFSFIVIKYPHLCAIFQSQVSRYVSLLWIDKVTNHQGTRALHSDIYTIPCPFIQIKQGNTQKKLASGLLDASAQLSQNLSKAQLTAVDISKIRLKRTKLQMHVLLWELFKCTPLRLPDKYSGHFSCSGLSE